MSNDFRFLMYQSAEENVSVNAIIKDETIWLSQKGMAELFGVQPPAILYFIGAIIQLPIQILLKYTITFLKTIIKSRYFSVSMKLIMK